MSGGSEKQAKQKHIQTDMSRRKKVKNIDALNRELKEANDEIDEMDGLILTSWNRLEEEKDKKREALRRYRISRSAS